MHLAFFRFYLGERYTMAAQICILAKIGAAQEWMIIQNTLMGIGEFVTIHVH